MVEECRKLQVMLGISDISQYGYCIPSIAGRGVLHAPACAQVSFSA